MKNLVYICIIAAIISLAAGIYSRITLIPLIFRLEANAFLRFTDTCLLFAIVLSLLEMLESKE